MKLVASCAPVARYAALSCCVCRERLSECFRAPRQRRLGRTFAIHDGQRCATGRGMTPRCGPDSPPHCQSPKRYPAMRRLIRCAVVAIAAVAATGCATTMTVSSHVDRGINFARYRTYDWGPADALPTGDPRLDKNPFFKDHVEGAVEKQLAARGLEMSTSGTPDLLFTITPASMSVSTSTASTGDTAIATASTAPPMSSRTRGRHTRARHRGQPHEPGDWAWAGPRTRLRACSTTRTRWRGRLATRPSRGCSPGFRRVSSGQRHLVAPAIRMPTTRWARRLKD